MLIPIPERIAGNLGLGVEQVEAAIALLDDGASVPFVARYRQEATQGSNAAGLGVVQLRYIERRLYALREVEARREAVLRDIQQQGRLSDELRALIDEAETLTALDDLHRPFESKQGSKAQAAIDAGLLPLADALWADPETEPAKLALAFIDTETGVKNGIDNTRQALDGARQILMLRIADDAMLNTRLRSYLWKNASLASRVVEARRCKAYKYSEYFEFSQRVKKLPFFRALALFRGRKEGFLTLEMTIPKAGDGRSVCEVMLAEHFERVDEGRPGDPWMQETLRFAWRVRLLPRLDRDIKDRIRDRADDAAIQALAEGFRDLLLTAPAGPRTVIGLHPGLKSGVKVAVVDASGELLEAGTLFPHPPQREWDQAVGELAELAARYQVELIGIGRGKAFAETEKWVTDLLKRHADLKLQKSIVNDVGASVYAYSDLGSSELEEIGPALRTAVSIARRLQDPLAELVKIDPMSLELGAMQGDVNKDKLAQVLEDTLEDCVNAVGVDLNRASVAMLSRICGLNKVLARNVVEWRNRHGGFTSREDLGLVPRFSELTFQQSAGFLRIVDGSEILDCTTIHPEAYGVVARMAGKLGCAVADLFGNTEKLETIDVSEYVDDRFGLPTINAIITELKHPAKDPRPAFRAAVFQEGLDGLKDLKPGMIVDGVVSSVMDFGAFVDLGVHADGLIHVSAMSDRFVDDANEIVKEGDDVKVRVLKVDLERGRIALTLRLDDEVGDVGVSQHSQEISGIKAGMTVDGKISSVSDFGAFVDLGAEVDGLIHVSAMSGEFVNDPLDVVKMGQTVKVKVLEVDVKRQRIALSLRLDDEQPQKLGRGRGKAGNRARSDNRRTFADKPDRCSGGGTRPGGKPAGEKRSRGDKSYRGHRGQRGESERRCGGKPASSKPNRPWASARPDKIGDSAQSSHSQATHPGGVDTGAFNPWQKAQNKRVARSSKAGTGSRKGTRESQAHGKIDSRGRDLSRAFANASRASDDRPGTGGDSRAKGR